VQLEQRVRDGVERIGEIAPLSPMAKLESRSACVRQVNFARRSYTDVVVGGVRGGGALRGTGMRCEFG
jgi:hypothetical protein